MIQKVLMELRLRRGIMTKEAVVDFLNELESFSSGKGYPNHYIPNEWTFAPLIGTIATQDEKAVWPGGEIQIRFNMDAETLETRKVVFEEDNNKPFYDGYDNYWKYYDHSGNERDILGEGHWVHTGREGIRPGTEIQMWEFEFQVDGKKLKLDNGTIEHMTINGNPIEEINTDTTLWMAKDAAKGKREYIIYTKSGEIYGGSMDWQGKPEDVDGGYALGGLSVTEDKETNTWKIGKTDTGITAERQLSVKPRGLYQTIKFQEIVSISLVTDRVKREAYRYGNTL